jgi:hypothetical protein
MAGSQRLAGAFGLKHFLLFQRADAAGDDEARRRVSPAGSASIDNADEVRMDALEFSNR